MIIEISGKGSFASEFPSGNSIPVLRRDAEGKPVEQLVINHCRRCGVNWEFGSKEHDLLCPECDEFSHDPLLRHQLIICEPIT